MDKLDYAVLNVLNEQEANSKLKAISIADILEELSVNEKTLARRIKAINEQGYIEQGLKVGKAYTYYITESGKNILEEALK